MIIRIFVIIFVIFCIISIVKNNIKFNNIRKLFYNQNSNINNQMFSTEQDFKINLEKELKKGKFLIGLKQYLGGENESFSKKKEY